MTKSVAELEPLALPAEEATEDLHSNNIVVVSDTHCGCQMGLCHPDGIVLDGGGEYYPSPLQLQLYEHWQTFWHTWVPKVCRGEPFAVIVNGDALDGVHHGSKTQVTQNLKDQPHIAEAIFAPIVELCKGRLVWIRGTEAHAGKSAEEEERLAERMGAIPDKLGRHARDDLWARVGGRKGGLIHVTHAIGVTGTSSYESTAPHKEIIELLQESARWGDCPPDVVVRSHRHRNIQTQMPTARVYGISFVTAGWQLKTPFAYKTAGGRVSLPQIGGSLIRHGDEETYTRHCVWNIARSEEVIL